MYFRRICPKLAIIAMVLTVLVAPSPRTFCWNGERQRVNGRHVCNSPFHLRWCHAGALNYFHW
jgi:hypothetical protein